MLEDLLESSCILDVNLNRKEVHVSHKKFDEKTSREIVIHFLNRLKTECNEQFSTTSLEHLCQIVDLFSNNLTSSEIWKTTYQMTFGKPLELISEEAIFTTLIGFCAKQTYNYKFNLRGLTQLLFLIRYRSEEQEKASAIWKETVAAFSPETLL